MELLKLKNGEKGIVTYIEKHNHECRLHGINTGSMLNIIHHYLDKVVLIVNFRETVTIPKGIAKYITVEAIK